MSRYARLRPVRRATVTATAVLGACAALVAAGPVAAAAEGTGAAGARYVALGDSYASGYGITPIENEVCGRAKVSYPTVVIAADKSASLKNVACSGATTRAIWNEHKGQPKQISALKPDTTHVTVNIGGNDIGFEKIVTECAVLGLQQPTGSPCKSKFEAEVDAAFGKLKGRLASVAIDVKRKSPKAVVALVGYPKLLPADGSSCNRSEVPFASGDFAFLHGILVRLNDMIKAEAAQGGALYIDTYKPSADYDMCAPKNKRMIQPLLEGGRIAPAAAHPNAPGILRLGAAVSQALAKHSR
ncbi:SGNH/GDSL hydrolase family protein [Nonomuraea sp. SYSU D8015]|uniref:SGNH/GDSL hydrolase family protein n=1 Tax=Nonomuraea sp. SYSU D8015 TaxID=2593644 RepID=UPI00166069FE|nr:SGNH/GDSL hydrolase family protein [Nonomuraea sp. SYSU D8015]